MNKDDIHLNISSHPRFLQVARAVSGKAARIMGFAQQDCRNIILAVDEACSNIIRHSYGGDPGGKIDLYFELGAKALTIRIQDDGIQCDIKKMKPRNIEELRPGGFGIYIMDKVMDSLEYNCSSHGRNQVTMTKNLTA